MERRKFIKGLGALMALTGVGVKVVTGIQDKIQENPDLRKYPMTPEESFPPEMTINDPNLKVGDVLYMEDGHLWLVIEKDEDQALLEPFGTPKGIGLNGKMHVQLKSAIS